MRTTFFLLALSVFLSPLQSALAENNATNFEVAGIDFKRPATWEWVPVRSPMRKAQLKVVDPDSKQTAEVVFFAGFGGSVKENVERWFRQFEQPRDAIDAQTEEVKLGKYTVTYASAQGTYLSGMPGGAKTPLKDHALLGAIIETERGNIFVRMTGPIPLVRRSTDVFRKMIQSGLK